MKIVVGNKPDRVLRLKVKHGEVESGRPLIWEVGFKMLDVGQRNAFTSAQLTLTPEERGGLMFDLVCKQLTEIACDEVELTLEGDKPVDWSNKSLVKNILDDETVFGMAFVSRVWMAYEEELDKRLGNLGSPSELGPVGSEVTNVVFDGTKTNEKQ